MVFGFNLGVIGKYAQKAFNGIKQGVGTAGKWIGDKVHSGIEAAKTAGKWAYDNRHDIAKFVGGAVEGIGAATGNPALMALGAGARIYGNSKNNLSNIPDGEAKNELIQNINNRQLEKQNAELTNLQGMMMANNNKQPAKSRKKPKIKGPGY